VKKLHKKKSLDYQETSLTYLLVLFATYIFFMILNPVFFLLIPDDIYWGLDSKYWMAIPFVPLVLILMWYTFRKKDG
jgi:uncharacterized membrane protein